VVSSATLSLTQIALRHEICQGCECRTPGEGGGCESDCSVFRLLPRIIDLVDRFKGEPPCGYGFAVRSLLRHAQDSGAVAAGSADRHAQTLDRHAETTIAVVEQVLSQSAVDRRAS